MERPKVKQFDNIHEYVAAWLDFKRENREVESLRDWAKQLGYRTAGHLSNIINAKRAITPRFIEKLADNCDLDPGETSHLVLMSQYGKLKNSNSQNSVIKQLVKSSAQINETEVLALDKFKIIKDWYHLPILQYVLVNNFEEDYQDIANKLNGHVSAFQVEMAIKRLLRLKLLVRDENGRLRKGDNPSIRIGEDVASEDIKAFHKTFLEIARKEIETQSVDEREYSSTSLPISKANVPLLKQLIREFVENLHQLSSSGEVDEVYQVNIQAFKLFNKWEKKHDFN